MDWLKLLSNVLGSAIFGGALHTALANPGSGGSWKAVGISAAVAAVSNLAGLVQTPPTAPGAPGA